MVYVVCAIWGAAAMISIPPLAGWNRYIYEVRIGSVNLLVSQTVSKWVLVVSYEVSNKISKFSTFRLCQHFY